MHGQLHDQLKQISGMTQKYDHLDRTIELLREGFDAIALQLDQDRSSALSTAKTCDSVVAKQRRMARKLNESVEVLKAGISEALQSAEAAAQGCHDAASSSRTQANQMSDELRRLSQENESLKVKVEETNSRNVWLQSKMETLQSRLATSEAARQQTDHTLARLVTEMEQLTSAVTANQKKLQEGIQQLNGRLDDVEHLAEERQESFQSHHLVGVEELQREMRKNEKVLLLATSRQAKLKTHIDAALTALATETRAGLLLTQNLEERQSATEAGLDQRFGAVSEAVRALAAVVAAENR